MFVSVFFTFYALNIFRQSLKWNYLFGIGFETMRVMGFFARPGCTNRYQYLFIIFIFMQIFVEPMRLRAFQDKNKTKTTKRRKNRSNNDRRYGRDKWAENERANVSTFNLDVNQFDIMSIY